MLTIHNQQVAFEVFPTEESVLSVSRNFCIQNQDALGIAPITEQTLPTCQQPLVDALVQAIRSDSASEQIAEVKVCAIHYSCSPTAVALKVINIQVNIDSTEYFVRFRPAVEPVGQVARDFCITNADSLGLTPLTEETLPGCRDPVAEYLLAQLQSIA